MIFENNIFSNAANFEVEFCMPNTKKVETKSDLNLVQITETNNFTLKWSTEHIEKLITLIPNIQAK
jgi:hypothetical protein